MSNFIKKLGRDINSNNSDRSAVLEKMLHDEQEKCRRISEHSRVLIGEYKKINQAYKNVSQMLESAVNFMLALCLINGWISEQADGKRHEIGDIIHAVEIGVFGSDENAILMMNRYLSAIGKEATEKSVAIDDVVERVEPDDAIGNDKNDQDIARRMKSEKKVFDIV